MNKVVNTWTVLRDAAQGRRWPSNPPQQRHFRRFCTLDLLLHPKMAENESAKPVSPRGDSIDAPYSFPGAVWWSTT